MKLQKLFRFYNVDMIKIVPGHRNIHLKLFGLAKKN